MKVNNKTPLPLFIHLLQLKGRWDEGHLQEGKWIMFNGDFYEGEFSHNKPNGKGKW